ncbi:MAG: ester cyclase [Candidatus Limnocylindrales bacterium]
MDGVSIRGWCVARRRNVHSTLANGGRSEVPMDHAATLRRFYDLISAGDIDRFIDLLADDFVEHEETPGLAPTKEGVRAFFRMQLAAFPDLRMDPQDVLVSGDKAVARVRFTGTQQGAFIGMPATGKRVDIQLIDILRFGDDGLAHEHWGVIDALAMMQQLGAIPAGPPA